MKGKLGMSLLLVGLASSASASMESNPGAGMGEMPQQESRQADHADSSADSSNAIRGTPSIFFGRIEKVEDNGFVLQSDGGQFLKLQVSKDGNIVCSNGSRAKSIGPTDEEANKDGVYESGFLAGGSDCRLKPGDMVRIEAADAGRMTKVTRLAYEEDENGSQIATDKEEELSTSTQ